MEYFVYLLRSKLTGKLYTGQTNNLEVRLVRHNRGDSFATKHDRPWEIVYTEKYRTRSEAFKRERFLNSPQGWKELQRLKQIVLLKVKT